MLPSCKGVIKSPSLMEKDNSTIKKLLKMKILKIQNQTKWQTCPNLKLNVLIVVVIEVIGHALVSNSHKLLSPKLILIV